ncbi:hypothetical protein [Butyrivibrio sp. MC2013]|uniref:hypothetical protein n=1 Tax=Butyrivibrio sp. MC2013 TaxID=1280686 RepID=UPI0003FF5EBA|nr:hypothetical protein [Butyrivibrio sp. MC2013]
MGEKYVFTGKKAVLSAFLIVILFAGVVFTMSFVSSFQKSEFGEQLIVNPIVPLTDETTSNAGTSETDSQGTYTEDYSSVYSKMERDLMVIPDKYNTGCNEKNMSLVVSPDNVDSLNLPVKIRTDGVITFQPKYSVNYPDEIVFSDTDFQFNKTSFFYADLKDVGTSKTVVFNNCRFKEFSTTDNDGGVVAIFNNCSFNKVTASHATFRNCYFGGANKDALDISRHVSVYDSYISDLIHPNPSYVLGNPLGHTDGIQIISGTEECDNIHLKNVRIEVPNLIYPVEVTENAVNSCIIATNKTECPNFTIEDCFFNGGGYTLYVTTAAGKPGIHTTMSNVRLGCAKKWGKHYCIDRDTSSVLTINNVEDTDQLYVGSVWRDSDGIHLSVTNDTNQDRILLVRTEDGDTRINVPAFPLYSQLVEGIVFDDLPIDVHHVIKSGSPYVVCFDDTDGQMNQIRFVDF